MGVRNTAQEGKAALFDSATGLAFGPVFDSEADLDDFLEWHNSHGGMDLRQFTPVGLAAIIEVWNRERAS